MTLSLPVGDNVQTVQRLTCAAAVAVCEAIGELTGLSPAVKWVNDVYVNGRKVAGILAELVSDEENRPAAVIIGIGVNLTTEGFPEEFADRAGSVGDIDANLLCTRIADNLTERYDHLNDNSFLEQYRELSLCLGRRIRYTDADGDHIAEAIGIGDDGCLIVTENGIKKSLRSGEISIKV